MDCSPAAIARASRCWCFPADRARAAKLFLLCSWANAGGAPPCTLPTAPVDLGASAGDGQVTLTWPAGVGATGYNIKRALVPGGPYTVIGTSAASPYGDLTAANGTTYYYVVSSTNACGESAGNSIESHATPLVVVVSNWVSRVQVNGGALPSLNTTKAMNGFVLSLRACAIENLMIAVNAFAPDSLIAALTPLYVGPGSDPWTNHLFVAGDLTVNGLKGDGVGKYLQTGIIPANVYTATNAGMSLYCPEAYNTASFGYDMAASDAAITSLNSLNFLVSANSIVWQSFNGASGVAASNTFPYFVGFLSGNRVAVNNSAVYEASSTVPFFTAGSNALSGGNLALITNELYVFAANFGFAFGFHTLRFSFAAMHSGLTAVQDQCLYNAVRALRVALGGGFSPNAISNQVIIADGSGGFWGLIVDVSGLVGTISLTGPATPDVVIFDGAGGYWQVIVDVSGNLGTTSVAGPETGAVTMIDMNLVSWTLVVDTLGNLFATS